MRKLLWLSCVVFVLTLVSSSFGAAVPMLLGDFETPAVGGRYDGWWEDGLTMVNVTTPAAAITLRTHALKGTTTVGGWGPGWQVNISGLANGIDTATAPEACMAFDYTIFPADLTGTYCNIGLTLNCAATVGGWNKLIGSQAGIIDGLPHQMVIAIDAVTKTKLIEGAAGWGSNLGISTDAAAGNVTIYIDNVRLLPSPPQDELLPHDPAVNQVRADAVENATFTWQAAADPNEVRGLPVDPNIVDQYVFINDGTVDGILKYHGKTGVDPGTEPNSIYGPITRELNKAYKWAVVEAMAGHQQIFTTDSTLAEVDPNNLTGPVWRFNSINTLPVITAQPVNGRAPLGALNVSAFTIGVDDNTAAYQWYRSADNVIDLSPTDFKMTSPSATTNTLILGTGVSGITVGNQAYYYCVVSNATTVSGGGTYQDVWSNVVSFVPERILAQYKFENDLIDAAPVTTDRHNGTGVNSPTFVTDSVEGTYALSLNGTNQYVTLGTTAYPKAVLADVGGIAGGLDIGSILCWVKATKAGAILSNADPNGRATFQVETNGGGSMTVRGGTTQMGYASALSAPYYNLINDGNWHLLAATWNKAGVVRMYVDTTRVQTNAANASFAAWMYSGLIGADRFDSDYLVPTSFFGGLIDNLRVYNYVVTPETIAQEYYDETGTRTCINSAFTGSIANLDNTGTSQCKVDLADLAVLAQSWLTNGFYPL